MIQAAQCIWNGQLVLRILIHPHRNCFSQFWVFRSNIVAGAAGEDDAGNDHKGSKEEKNDDF